MQPGFRRLFLFQLLLIIVLFALIGCGGRVDQTVTLLEDSNWQTEITITIPTETLLSLGSPDQIASQLDGFVQQMEAEGASASWDSRTARDTTYTLKASGTDLSVLQDKIFNGDMKFVVRESSGVEQVVVTGFWSPFSDAEEAVLTLEGREVVASNGTVQSAGSVQWVNQPVVEAVIIPDGPLNLSVGVLLILLLAAVAIGVAVYIYLTQPKKEKTQFRKCSGCGASIASSSARFCTYCGSSLDS